MTPVASDGKKMGKTAAGAVWLDKELLPEFDYWQFWRNTADADVIRFVFSPINNFFLCNTDHVPALTISLLIVGF